MNALKFDLKDTPQLEEKKKIPIFLYHGNKDNMINHNIAKMSYQTIFEMKFNTEMTIEEGLEHTLSEKELLQISKFIHK